MWRSTELDVMTIELTYLEGQSADDASKLLVVRMPSTVGDADSLAFARLQALKQARDIIGAEIQRLSAVVHISDRERADKALMGSFGKRLTYRRTAALAA